MTGRGFAWRSFRALALGGMLGLLWIGTARGQSRDESSPRAPEREMRTAFSAPPASNNGLLAGAQPVVPAGTFDNRFSGLR